MACAARSGGAAGQSGCLGTVQVTLGPAPSRQFWSECGPEPWCLCLLAVWPWTSPFIALDLTFGDTDTDLIE